MSTVASICAATSALAGRTHTEILAAYYPGTSLGSWPPPANVPAALPDLPR